MPVDDEPREALLEYLSRPDYRPLTQKQLLHRMRVAGQAREHVRRAIRGLQDEGRLASGRGGRLMLRAPERVSGVLHRHRDGYGFVVPDEHGLDVFVAPPNLGDHLSGDRVEARITRRGRGNRLEGVIVRTIERRSRRSLGVFFGSPPGGSVQPFEAGLSDPVHVPEKFRSGARPRQVVRFEIVHGPGRGQPAEGKVLEVLGELDEPGMDVRIVARKYGLEQRFSPVVERAAAKLPSRIGKQRAAGRTRFSDPPPITIDGETAQDFDDAVAVERTRDGFRLYVHIADVASFVEANDPIDEEARRRGTSVYFPGTVLPMLPEELSNELCSLRPGVDRLVQTAIVDFDPDGEPVRTEFADGIIRSAARLTYEQVERVIAGERVAGVPRVVLPMIGAADRLRRLHERRRQRRGSIDFDLPEPEILLDVEGEMTGVRVEPRNRAHRLIEEFMIATNEAVARYLESGVDACVFRVHDRPDPAKLEGLARFVSRFGLDFPTDGQTIESRDYQRLLAAVDAKPESSLVNSVALRSMKQARYSTDNIGHFSLASSCYCHFTSPIRRYPDLLIHRLLRAARSGRAPGETERADLELWAERCSELERNAESAERELLNWKKVAYIEDKVGESFDSVVTGVTTFGLFCRLESNLVEGLLRVEELGDERFDFDASRQELLGRRSGRAWGLGQRLRVRVERVDRVLQRVDFAPAD
ncbi:MAG TPA: ribonuclease R [Candidatus Polarisedimenticolaceae bacterium]|nr:ribonuclease R [Candidatus Polarisedimenticolaceae bacterium]